MAKHTQGPWETYRDRNGLLVVRASHNRTIASVFVPSVGDQEANGSLMAAAPDMLEALKMVLQHGRIDDSESMMAQVAAAITKAEGF